MEGSGPGRRGWMSRFLLRSKLYAFGGAASEDSPFLVTKGLEERGHVQRA
jgi:hypothetical protein